MMANRPLLSCWDLQFGGRANLSAAFRQFRLVGNRGRNDRNL